MQAIIYLVLIFFMTVKSITQPEDGITGPENGVNQQDIFHFLSAEFSHFLSAELDLLM